MFSVIERGLVAARQQAQLAHSLATSLVDGSELIVKEGAKVGAGV